MSIRTVIEKLEQLDALHTDLLQLEKKKKEVLIQSQVDELSKITQMESRLMRSISGINQQWVQAAADFLADKGYRPEPMMTVSEMLKLVFHAEDRQALQEVQKRLSGTLEQLKKINALNQQLIEQSLAFIDYSIDLVSGPSEQDAVYRHPIQAHKGTRENRMFDTKA